MILGYPYFWKHPHPKLSQIYSTNSSRMALHLPITAQTPQPSSDHLQHVETSLEHHILPNGADLQVKDQTSFNTQIPRHGKNTTGLYMIGKLVGYIFPICSNASWWRFNALECLGLAAVSETDWDQRCKAPEVFSTNHSQAEQPD